MKIYFIIALFQLFVVNSWSQDNYFNKTFSVISPSYSRESCKVCKQISSGLYKHLKKESSLFQENDEYPFWSYAKENNDFIKYQHIDFFLTSEIKETTQGYKVIFEMFELAIEKPHHSENFIHIIHPDGLESNIINVVNIIISELEYFKSNKHFKKLILVDKFEAMTADSDLDILKEKFSDWLSEELRYNDKIKSNYHIFHHKNSNLEIDNKNKLDGEIYNHKSTQIKVDIIVKMVGKKPESCKRFFLQKDNYKNNHKEILDEIIRVINRLEKRS